MLNARVHLLPRPPHLRAGAPQPRLHGQHPHSVRAPQAGRHVSRYYTMQIIGGQRRVKNVFMHCRVRETQPRLLGAFLILQKINPIILSLPPAEPGSNTKMRFSLYSFIQRIKSHQQEKNRYSATVKHGVRESSVILIFNQTMG